MTRQAMFLFDMGVDRVSEVTSKRGPIVSALMKAIRLQREEDAVYWVLALLRGGQERGYLGRRCFGSACEDNFNLQALEMGSELAKRPPKAELPYLQSVIASSRGSKWYWPMAKAYTIARCEAYENQQRVFEDKTVEELEELCRVSLRQQQFVPFFVAYRELKKERQRNAGIVNELIEVGKASPMPEARRLAAATAPHTWQCIRRENNPIWMLVWILSEGPFEGMSAPVDLTGADQTIAAAEARWGKKDLEPVPSWALDGVHTTGSDERFAGTWAGLRNCVAMYAKYGRLSPADEGVLIREGTVVTRRRKGLWPVLVPSRTHPDVAYEIEPDGIVGLRCSCPAFRWRSRSGSGDCTHLKAFRAQNPDAESLVFP
jgi:hypothetical protein